jgi:hypothetical protein
LRPASLYDYMPDRVGKESVKQRTRGPRAVKLTPENLLEEIEFRSTPEPNTGCWLWTGGMRGDQRRGDFRPVVRWNGRYETVSRILLNAPPDLFACHRCDQSACVNPAHLFLGTASDNVRDAVRKRRLAKLRRTLCPKGHPYDGVHRHGSSSARRCLRCHRESEAARKVARHGR